jgi:hypothetical protein
MERYVHLMMKWKKKFSSLLSSYLKSCKCISVLPFDFEIKEFFENFGNWLDNSQLKQWVDMMRTYEHSKQDNLVIRYIEIYQTKHIFYDPIVDYMEGFPSWKVQPCFH